MNPLKPAMTSLSEIFERLNAREVALFVDYDGTLAPIAPTPDEAQLSDTMRQTLRALAEVCAVAVVSGRALADVRERVGLDTLAYAGSHGFEITGPSPQGKDSRSSALPTGQRIRFEAMHLEKGRDSLPLIERAEGELRLRTGRIDGVIIERKPFGIGLHYRQAADQDIPTITKHLNFVLREFPGLRVTAGKKIYDIRPDIDWNKGKAVLWMLKQLKASTADASEILGIYMGDDTTDEDAFRALRPEGITVAVQSTPRSSAAEYRLTDPGAVQEFLDALLGKLSAA